MRRFVTITFSIMLVFSITSADQTNYEHNSTQGNTLLPASESYDSITRLIPVKQDYGVGYTKEFFNGIDNCFLENAPDSATFGFSWGTDYCAWVIWDLSMIPSGAEIVKVEIEHELKPHTQNSGDRYYYRKLDSLLVQPPDCMDAYNILNSGVVYQSAEYGYLPGIVKYDLQENARMDVVAAIERQDYFSVAITKGGSASTSVYAGGIIPGWDAGGPNLIVTWRRTVSVENRSWGSIKKSYSE